MFNNMSNMIDNLKASDLGEEKACEVINAAAEKCYNEGNAILQRYENNEDIDSSYEQGLKTTMINMMLQLLDLCDIIDDLTGLTIIGAKEHLTNKLGFTNEDINEMSEEELEPYIKRFQIIQHKFADFNNNEIRAMLFEVAKQVLTEKEILEIL